MTDRIQNAVEALEAERAARIARDGRGPLPLTQEQLRSSSETAMRLAKASKSQIAESESPALVA